LTKRFNNTWVTVTKHKTCYGSMHYFFPEELNFEINN